jgi:uncharacterized protein YigE (DUF2233 family)
MKKTRFFALLLLLLSTIVFVQWKGIDDSRFVSLSINPSKQQLAFYLKNEAGLHYNSIQNLKNGLARQHKTLIFATNGGMYMPDHSPQGLYIENGKLIKHLDTATSGYGNFYLKPNGVFYINAKREASVCNTEDYTSTKQVMYATQSGPMLVIDGAIHPAFKQGSTNLNIRNGVGILPNGDVLFAMSKTEINFYDFANYFKQAGCNNALYLDGFVSRTYLPAKQWTQTDGNFGVLIGCTEMQKKK